jgi:phosphoglycerate dehydrogenase-like enzyme
MSRAGASDGPLRIVHRFGPIGEGLEQWVGQVVPDTEIVAWPGPGEILITLDGAWGRGGDDAIPPGIRWAHVFGAGVGGFPVGAMDGRPDTGSRGASAAAIPEFVRAAVLAAAKRLPETWITEPPRAWSSAQLDGLERRTLGLVGLGAIGTEIARRALAFEMTVVAVRRSGRAAGIPGVEVVPDLGAVLAVADHLVVAAPATAETRHLIDADALAAMKPGAHLVNIARGSLVDQDALLGALDAGHLALATLDVVEPEPLPSDHPFYRHPRVRLSPHVSWSSPETMPRTMQLFVDNLERYRAGQPLRGLVDAAAGY